METPQAYKNAPSTIKVPLQRLSKTGKTVFAYMRRSTTKKEQASSLPQQAEGIEIIAEYLGINLSEVRSFTESKSGYENRKRPEWLKLVEEMDALIEPCIILCRDTSRLSRNPTDNLEIANRIFGDNKQKKVIEAIYYLGTGMKVEKWDDKTNKKVIVDTLHQNYTDSMENKEKCIGGVLLKLDAGEFPYHPPHGLKRVNHLGEPRRTRSEQTVLMQDDKMPFVRHAFEMKAKGRSAKEICQYLKHYGNINLSTKNIIETLIGNTVYKGEYREKTSGKLFDKIKFWEGKPPIDRELWERANAKVGKRGHGFGEGQKDHIAPGILKYETGKDLYLYKAKGKYNAYQTEIKGENGKRKSIGIMESKLVKGFLSEAIPKISLIYYLVSEAVKNDMGKSAMEVIEEVIDEWKEGQEKIQGQVAKKKTIEVSEEAKKETIEMASNMIGNLLFKNTTDSFGKLLKIDHTAKEIQRAKIKELEGKKKELEVKKNTIEDEAWDRGFDMEFVKRKKGQIDEEIQGIEGQIEMLSESSNIEEYLDRLPQIVLDLHELASRVQSEADYEEMRDDIRQLMELVSHELTLTNKKELRIKLLDAFENLENGKIGNGATDRTRTCDLLLRREAF